MRSEDPPFWDADSQRQRLRGFSRVRAIFWRRSVLLYEYWKLWSQPWYRPLRPALNRAFSGLDPFERSRVTQASQIFGETPIITIHHLLKLASEDFVHRVVPFVDLGSGRGLPGLTAASCGFSSQGYEQEGAWVEAAGKAGRSLGLDCTFLEGDFRDLPWPERGTFYATATAWSDCTKSLVERKFRERAGGTILILLDWAPQLGEGFRTVWAGKVPVDWGVASALILVKEEKMSPRAC